jgi:hypothetical protein
MKLIKNLFTLFILACLTFVAYQAWSERSGAKAIEVESVDDLIGAILDIRAEQTIEVGDIDFGDDTQLNVLLLGLDERKEETELEDAHCDAIHMFTLDIKYWTIMITSVPRGTGVYIPGGPYAETDYYLANACAFAGLDYGVEQIEQIIGVKADYVATVGFSQTYGILRLLNLPTSESLQWLRHRQSYQIGEPQRVANQATFIKDIIVSHISTFESDITLPLQYVLYSFVDTDMSFAVAHTLLEGFINSSIDERPDDIQTQLRPYYPTQELHFDLENYDEQLASIVEYLRPYLSDEDLSEIPLEQIQTYLVDFIFEQIELEDDLTDILDKQLWLQVDSDSQREEVHYSVIEQYARQALSDGDQNTAVKIVTDYILEKELLEIGDWEDRGRELLSEVLK